MFWLRRLLAAFIARARFRPQTTYERAVATLERGDLTAAIAAFTACLHEAVDDAARVRAYNKRGVAHVRLGNRDEARRDFGEALALDGRFAPAITNIGNLHFEQGDLAEAVTQYQAAIRADETYAIAHLNLGAAYRKLGRRSDAVRELRIANRLEGRQLLGPLRRFGGFTGFRGD
ncbi:MAG: tetratricopeptide repeat protein [Candidatus Eremiobacteraeota bacterium]|nr:tetratricopeptide repeat protein [Candidatus Eremiobacteraeota bacterium]